MTTDTPAQDTPQAAAASTSQTDHAKVDSGDTGSAKTALTQDLQAKPDAADTSKSQPSDAKKDKDGSDSKDGDNGQDTDKDKPKGAPESYADFTLPENMEVNAAVLDEFKGMAKEVNLPQEQAQKFVEMGAKLTQEAVENFALSQVEAYAKKVEGWHKTRAEDTELGGTEDKQKEVLSHASKVAKALGGESLLKAMDETGAGNHPEVIRSLYRLRDLIGEDGKLIQGNLGGNEPKTAAQALYPNLPTQAT
jgi:hypothetical protein